MNQYFKKILQTSVVPPSLTDNNIVYTIGKIRMPTNSKALSPATMKKLELTAVFGYTEEIFNLYNFVKTFMNVLNNYSHTFTLEDAETLLASKKISLLAEALGCTEKCPSCNKCCEKPLNHPGAYKISYGHHILSMGGHVWSNPDRYAIVKRCDGLADWAMVTLPNGKQMKFSDFKNHCNNWDWTNVAVTDDTVKKSCKQ